MSTTQEDVDRIGALVSRALRGDPLSGEDDAVAVLRYVNSIPPLPASPEELRLRMDGFRNLVKEITGK